MSVESQGTGGGDLMQGKQMTPEMYTTLPGQRASHSNTNSVAHYCDVMKWCGTEHRKCTFTSVPLTSHKQARMYIQGTNKLKSHLTVSILMKNRLAQTYAVLKG